jgi:hypothetical protein
VAVLISSPFFTDLEASLVKLAARHPQARADIVGILRDLERIHQLAARIDARQINPRFPKTFPRLVQFAIWSFCAETRHLQRPPSRRSVSLRQARLPGWIDPAPDFQ